MSKFDPSKPYATIHGDVFGRAFDQDNRQFDGEGNEIIITDKMRAEQLAREAEAAAEGGDDKDAVIAALTRRLANMTGDDKPKEDSRDAKIKELEKAVAEKEAQKAQQKAPQKPAPTNESAPQGLTMANIHKQ